MANIAYSPNPETARQVETLSGIGLPQTQIATVIGIDTKTLRKYYRDDLDRGIAKANSTVLSNLFSAATSSTTPWPQRIAAMIFWSKARCGFSEKMRHEHTGADGAPLDDPLETAADLSRLPTETLMELRDMRRRYRQIVAAAMATEGDRNDDPTDQGG